MQYSDELQAALFEYQRYLLDQIPPLTALDAFQTLMEQRPELLMQQMSAWAVEQSRLQDATIADCLFHAVSKAWLFSSLHLIDRAAVEPYLNKLLPLALEACPPAERDLLRTNLIALRDSKNLTPSAAVSLGRLEGAKPKTAAADKVSDVVTRSARRLGLIIDRLARKLPGAAAERSSATREAASPQPIQTPVAELVSMAAASSASEEELQQYMEKLKPYTGSTNVENLFGVLATSLPAWDILIPASVGTRAPAPVEAMHKIISLTRNPLEGNRRFRDLMTTAVEQFNNGSLSAASSMLELAQTIIVEKKIDPSTVERVRAEAAQAINNDQLKRYAENKAKHPLLRKVLSSFPSLTKEQLFADLRGEEKPERRRALLGLLEAYGTDARDMALTELEKELTRQSGEIDTYYLRNVIYLLHRIQRDPDAPVDRELDLLTKASARNQSIYVIKEAVIPIGHIKTEAAVKLLTLRLAEFEALLLKKDTSQHPMQEMQKLLDRIIAALARIGTPAALLTVARHGMKPNPLLGDSRSRLAALSQHDLSFDEQTVMLLVNAIREDLPGGILGRVLPKRQPPPLKLIEALSGTRSDPVEKLFAEIAAKYPDQDLGRAAAAALERVTSDVTTSGARTGAATLTGDLQFFGLPSLMQSLADTQATGIVTLSSKDTRQTAGKLLFSGGKFVDAQVIHLRGVDAVYQMLERPIVGTFSFVPQPAEKINARTTEEVMPLLFEGIRRHDELKQFSAVVPDDLALKAAGKPTADPDESDPAVVRDVWVKASSGGRLGEWESTIPADAYRVRRLVARWVEEGALLPA